VPYEPRCQRKRSRNQAHAVNNFNLPQKATLAEFCGLFSIRRSQHAIGMSQPLFCRIALLGLITIRIDLAKS
jgi:hypothetical protein